MISRESEYFESVSEERALKHSIPLILWVFASDLYCIGIRQLREDNAASRVKVSGKTVPETFTHEGFGQDRARNLHT